MDGGSVDRDREEHAGLSSTTNWESGAHYKVH
jgi:hypothetical protein